MNHITFASLGLLVIGLVTTAVVSWLTFRRISDSTERSAACRWSAMFGLTICTLMSVMPLVGENQLWILLLPFAGTWLSLDSLHRLGYNASEQIGKPVSGTS